MAHILVVDDSPEDRLLVMRALARSGEVFTCIEAADIDVAIELLTRGFSGEIPRSLPDLVLCDVRMASADGFELLTFIHSEALLQKVRLAFISGGVAPAIREEALRRGACAFIEKGDLIAEPQPFITAVKNCIFYRS